MNHETDEKASRSAAILDWVVVRSDMFVAINLASPFRHIIQERVVNAPCRNIKTNNDAAIMTPRVLVTL